MAAIPPRLGVLRAPLDIPKYFVLRHLNQFAVDAGFPTRFLVGHDDSKVDLLA